MRSGRTQALSVHGGGGERELLHGRFSWCGCVALRVSVGEESPSSHLPRQQINASRQLLQLLLLLFDHGPENTRQAIITDA